MIINKDTLTVILIKVFLKLLIPVLLNSFFLCGPRGYYVVLCEIKKLTQRDREEFIIKFIEFKLHNF
jgi:hypothetical protein